MTASRYCMVMVSVSNDNEAERIAKALVERKLAACVQAMPIQSTYMCEGQVQSEPERLLLIKTRRDKVESLKTVVNALHSYDVPEIIVVDISHGSLPYLNWIDAVLEV